MERTTSEEWKESADRKMQDGRPTIEKRGGRITSTSMIGI
jgi:hypothetical protein